MTKTCQWEIEVIALDTVQDRYKCGVVAAGRFMGGYVCARHLAAAKEKWPKDYARTFKPYHPRKVAPP